LSRAPSDRVGVQDHAQVRLMPPLGINGNDDVNVTED
jgi:hypothetical protein